MMAKKYKLSVFKDYWKCLSSDGEWDGTWDEWYTYHIEDESGYPIDSMSGYRTKEEAKEAGEEAVKRWEKIR